MVYTTMKKTGKYKNLFSPVGQTPCPGENIQQLQDQNKCRICTAGTQRKTKDRNIFPGNYGSQTNRNSKWNHEGIKSHGEMANMATINQTLMDIIRQHQKSITKLKILMTAKIAPATAATNSESNDTAIKN